jgi:hypothetical protein
MAPTLLALALSLAPAVDQAALAARCDRGFAVDCRDLGRARLAGQGVPQDDRLAAAHLTRACEIGDPAACSDLGVLYAVGRGLAQSDDRALALSRRSCDQGGALACSNHGALLAEGVGSAPPRLGPGEDPVMRLFRKACDAGVPEGCTNLGTALDAGRLAPRDVRAAARTLRRACDAGFAVACVRLAGLVQERADVAPDLTVTALTARGCRGGIAPACLAVSEPVPAPSARTPAARLVDDPRALVLGIPGMGGFSPGELAPRGAPGRPRRALGEVRRSPPALRAAVPEPLWARLGLDGPPSPAVAQADPAIELLLAFRRGQLGQCYEAARAVPAARADVHVVLFVDGDGRAVEVRAASVPEDAPLEECVRAAVEAWEFPASDDGFSGPFHVGQAFDAAPGPAPAYAAPGFLRPALRDPACVERALKVPPELRGSAGAMSVKLAVDAAGKPGLVHALSPAPDGLVAAVAAAVRGCPWTAGGDGDGRPLPLWTTLTVKIESR